MATPKKRSAWDRLRTAFKANDEAAFEEELTAAQDEVGEGEGDPQRIVIEVKGPEAPATVEALSDDGEGTDGEDGGDSNERRFSALEAAVAKIAEAVAKLTNEGEGQSDEGDDDTAETTKVAAMDAMSKAEILAPGIKMPKFDSATGSAAPIIALKRQALKTAHGGKHKAVIDTVLGGQPADFNKMKTPVLTVVFDSAAALVGAHNNAGGRGAPVIKQGGMTAAKLQELNVARRAKH